MISDYEIQNLINAMNGYMLETHNMHKLLLHTNFINNCTEEHKKQINDAYVKGLINNLHSGTSFDKEFHEKIINLKLIEESILSKKDEIKDVIFKKIVIIFENLTKRDERYGNPDKFPYESIIELMKKEIEIYTKNSIKSILEGDDKSIFETALTNITRALTKTSISNYADNLFKKAQTMINEELIKNIIE